ncbi:MAG: site-2 protease family protein [Candidatus Berkelbacteria bacterium]|nr:site-2 protease family protein [Candidatus Berkelbacteria bacterium]MCR4307727.1 site-2 protease family protein [Candidatus Berkelbacteria bacterium]
MLVTFLVFLVVLGVMVFVHELGHFLVAKKSGVKVEEFAFGFRPRLWSKKIGETTYAINLIPLGGYVKMFGESDGKTGPRSFKSKSPSSKVAILVAGATMNLLMAWVIFTILFITGFQPFAPNAARNPFLSEKPSTVIAKIVHGSPAELSGFWLDDQLLAVNGQNLEDGTGFVEKIRALNGQPATVTVKRGDLTLDLTVTPRINPPSGQGAIGVAVGQTGQVRSLWYKAPIAALYETGRVIGISAVGFVDFVKNFVIKQEVSEDVTGIVGVGALTGVARRMGFEYLAQLVALISIGLGVVNLMPILPLDGGHIAVLAYEKVTRRSLTERQFSIFATAGLAFILLMFLVVTLKDFVRFDVIGRLFS